MAFELPPNGREYYISAFEKAKYFIKKNLWNGIDLESLDAWWNNFNGEKEKYFAACLLNRVIFRNDSHQKSQIEYFLDKLLPSAIYQNERCEQEVANYLCEMSSHKVSNSSRIWFVSVLGKTQHSVGASSNPVLRKVNKSNIPGKKVSKSLLISPDKILEKCTRDKNNYFFFLDDNMGSGKQFSDCLSDFKVDFLIKHPDIKIIYCPLIAYKASVEELKKKYPEIMIMPVETLRDSHRIFHEDSLAFADGVNSVQEAEDFYYGIFKKRGIKLKKKWKLGFCNLGFSVFINDNAPNYTLPIFHENFNGKWEPLTQRVA